MSSDTITLADLRTIDLFDDLDDEQLREWVAVSYARHVEPGEVIAEQGQPPAGALLLLDGTAQTLIVDHGRTEPVGRQQAPTWIGAISVLTEGPLGVHLQALTACRLAIVPSVEFRRLAFAQPDVHRRVMKQVGPVLSRFTAMEQNRSAPDFARHDGRRSRPRTEQPGGCRAASGGPSWRMCSRR